MKYNPSNVLVSVNGVERKTNECEKIEINKPKDIDIHLQSTDVGSLDNGCLKKGDMVVRDYLKLSPVYKVSRIDGDKVFCSHHSNTKEYCFYHHHLRKATKKEVETSIK